ncbi:hypothetical protein [Microbacterium sp. SORGH_AS_0888]|uniref:hypothetical protein n=1 Tax=Microbacterium sp. SORGH_AS_0888 TaxID=3041791 RepID=UPI002781C52D|nr:hypothetical protein [Microbacterium sp. SORGH_AS_0888]MDQ1130400.1 hypothetical protein [Microbacterium sp. SORGH_AS_0888]
MGRAEDAELIEACRIDVRSLLGGTRVEDLPELNRVVAEVAAQAVSGITWTTASTFNAIEQLVESVDDLETARPGVWAAKVLLGYSMAPREDDPVPGHPQGFTLAKLRSKELKNTKASFSRSIDLRRAYVLPIFGLTSVANLREDRKPSSGITPLLDEFAAELIALVRQRASEFGAEQDAPDIGDEEGYVPRAIDEEVFIPRFASDKRRDALVLVYMHQRELAKILTAFELVVVSVHNSIEFTWSYGQVWQLEQHRRALRRLNQNREWRGEALVHFARIVWWIHGTKCVSEDTSSATFRLRELWTRIESLWPDTLGEAAVLRRIGDSVDSFLQFKSSAKHQADFDIIERLWANEVFATGLVGARNSWARLRRSSALRLELLGLVATSAFLAKEILGTPTRPEDSFLRDVISLTKKIQKADGSWWFEPRPELSTEAAVSRIQEVIELSGEQLEGMLWPWPLSDSPPS